MNMGESSSPAAGNRFRRYLQYASSILLTYQGTEPFHLYLKKYFSANKKHGSKDRKEIAALCYCYFRVCLGVSVSMSVEDKLLLATFILENKSSAILSSIKPEWNEKIELNLFAKLEMVKAIFEADKIFPFTDELSTGIDFKKFCLSFLSQPKLYIRIRPGNTEKVTQKLNSANIPFEHITDECIAFSNNEKVSEVILIDEEAVIQDYNSQRVGEFFNLPMPHPEANTLKIWDCCAASGGKSILAFDIFENIELTVSDSRKNILENLKFRFAKAGIKNYNSFVADLSVHIHLDEFKMNTDFIIADLPCSGSGTWARTPEQLHFFSKKSVKKYAILQQKIVTNAIQYLNAGGYFLYITCSVFKKENEENVEFIQKNLNLELIDSRYLEGYEMQADTLFAALFRK
ncbi:MAG: Fmu (Sun) domain-containing protein [Bacteroidota bacterium]|nr:Fmu (Sun) domain-containing protein [Bacteroidota bacterium]